MRSSLLDESEVRLGIGGVALLVATSILVRLALPSYAALAVVAAVLAVGSGLVRLAHALLLAVTAWGLGTGFVVHDLGRLTFTAADLARLGAAVGVGVVAWAAGGRVRRGATMGTSGGEEDRWSVSQDPCGSSRIGSPRAGSAGAR